MQKAARVFGKITARPKGNTDRVEGAGTGVGSTPAAGSRWFYRPAWLVTYLEMECGPGEAGTKLWRLGRNPEPWYKSNKDFFC